MKKVLLSVFLIINICCYAKIVEIKHIKEAYNLEKYDLVIFDLDNTIIEPVQLLGSDQWFFSRLKELEKIDPKNALEKTLVEWYEIQSVTDVKLVENEIKNLIENLQTKKVKIIGLTTRNLDFVFASLKQLSSLNINLDTTSPYNDTILDNNWVYKKGILFASGKNKGFALKSFFEKINFFPKSIVFIDDKLKHIVEVEDYCSLNKINFLGFRYGYLDEKVKKFDSKISNMQYSYFKNILSDDQVEKMINNKKS